MKHHLKINTTQEDLQKQIEALNPNEFLGVDGIYAKESEERASVISESPPKNFNESLKKKTTINMTGTFDCRNLKV